MFLPDRSHLTGRIGSGLFLLGGLSWLAMGVSSAMAVEAAHVATTSLPSVASRMMTSLTNTLPPDTRTVVAPDSIARIYRTLEGTHFSYRCHVSYRHESKTAAVELCEIDPVVLQIEDWPETEVVQLIKGAVTITEADGSVQIYESGDAFVLPQGFAGIWRQAGPLLKRVVRHPLFWEE